MNRIDYDTNQEVLASTEFRDWMEGLLKEEYPITVTFIKKDGTERMMRCTKNMQKIPVDHHPKTIADHHESNIRVYDLDNEGWRSFTPTSIKRIEFTIE